jgi:hypothetical protein
MRPSHTLLRHCGHVDAVAAEDLAGGQAAGALGAGGLLHVEQPLVHAEGTVPPHGVVQAGHRHAGGNPAHSVLAEDGLQDGVIAGIGQGRPVQLRIIRHRPESLHPHRVARFLIALGRNVQSRVDVADIEGPLVGPVAGNRVVVLAQEVGRAGQRLRPGDAGRHLGLVLDPLVLVLERCDHGQDGHALLVGVHAPRRERAAVPEPLDAEGDRLVGVPRTEEIAVHGVYAAPLGNGPAPGDQRLRQHLAAEHTVPGLLLRGAHKNVLVRPGTLELPEVQQLEE